MKHPCLKPKCPMLVGHGIRYCPTHERIAQQRDVAERGTAAQRGYDRAWQALATAYKRTHPHCEAHLTKGQQVPTEIVDHRVALRDGGPRLDPRNLQALCRSCHGVKTHAETVSRTPSRFFQATPQKTARQSSSSAPENSRVLPLEIFFA